MSKDSSFAEAYKALNPAQREAVDAIEGPVTVSAGPGTGKTQILTLRIANILLKTDTKPENVLALTFTNAGVIAMRERLLSFIGDAAYRVGIFTFHAFCEHVIKEFAFYFERLEGFKVVTDLARVEIIESIIKENKFSDLVSFHDEFHFLEKIISGILAIKKEGLSPEEFMGKLPRWKEEMLANEDNYYKKDFGKYKKGDLKPAEAEKIEKKINKARELGTIFSLYQRELKKRGLYDFSDMVLYVLEELAKNRDLRADLQEQYQYILVDEHQDTNDGQNAIVEFLTDAEHLALRPNIFTVGDEKQSIYRFQGASRETFSRFKSLYQDVRVIALKENYRSAQNILDGAHSLIMKSPGLEGSPALHSNIMPAGRTGEQNEKIRVCEFSNYKFELLYVAKDIKKKIENGAPPSEIAVLYRANRNVSDIKTIFDFYKIDYTIFSKDRVLDDPNIRNLIYILKAVHDLNDDHHLGKALFARFLNFDAYDVVRVIDKFKSLRENEKKHIFAVLNDKKGMQELGIKSAEEFSTFAKILKELKTESMNRDFPEFFKIFLEKIGYTRHMVASPDSRLQIMKIDKLLDEIKRQDSAKRGYSLSDFIYFGDAFAKYGLDIESVDPEIIKGVSLMTAHGSKGREFEHVYILNATRRSWEGSRARGTGIALPVYQYDGDIEDERRLFYVAMTRAKKSLHISYSKTDEAGALEEGSEFVKEIDPSFKDEVNMKAFEEENVEKLSAFLHAEGRAASIFEPEYVKKLFFERGLNVSALNNYLTCPLKYFYKNLIRIPDVYSPTLKFGDLIHKALEAFFAASAKAEKILPKKALLQAFEKELAQSNFPGKEEEKFRKRGEEALSEYYGEYHSSWTHRVRTEFNPKRDFELYNHEKIKLSGFVDKVEILDDDGNVNIVDYKTGRTISEKNKAEKEAYERQMVFYHLLLEDYDEGRVRINKCVFDFVEKNKKGKFERYFLEVTREHLNKLRAEINQCADGVLSMEFLKKGCNKEDCEWCQLA